jgi:hypothetical protein
VTDRQSKSMEAGRGEERRGEERRGEERKGKKVEVDLDGANHSGSRMKLDLHLVGSFGLTLYRR